MIPDREPIFRRSLSRLIYNGAQVRRSFSILLIAIFSLGPLTVLSSASEDAYLPACCRRNGAHQCAQAMQMAAATMIVPPGAPPIAKVPSHCPYYPQHPPVRATSVYTPSRLSAANLVLLVEALRPLGGSSSPLFKPVGPLAGRGPPAAALD